MNRYHIETRYHATDWAGMVSFDLVSGPHSADKMPRLDLCQLYIANRRFERSQMTSPASPHTMMYSQENYIIFLESTKEEAPLAHQTGIDPVPLPRTRKRIV